MKRETWDIATQGPPPVSMFAKKKGGNSRIRGLTGPNMNGLERAWGDELELSRLSRLGGNNVTGLAVQNVFAWLYEAVKLRLANGGFYTPDFFAVHSDRIMGALYEVKGPHARDDAKIKFKMAAAKYWKFFEFYYVRRDGGLWTVERYEPSDSDRVS